MTDETIVANINSLKINEEKQPHLTFIKGPRLGQIHPLHEGAVVVGRSQDCSLWVEDGAISRRHFKIIVKEGEVLLEDLGSTNGTFVNGKKVAQIALHDGDRIQISQDTVMEINYLDESKSLSEKKIYEMGVMDAVTNIYNKRYLINRLQEESSYAQRKQSPLSLVMIDIDFFKKLNDTYGHLAGDQCLKQVADRIGSMIRKSDIFARYGGEEFVIIMRDTETRQATELSDRIRENVSQLIISHEKQPIQLTISLGVAGMAPTMKHYTDLVEAADQNLYYSKSHGRNRVTGPNSNLNA